MHEPTRGVKNQLSDAGTGCARFMGLIIGVLELEWHESGAFRIVFRRFFLFATP